MDRMADPFAGDIITRTEQLEAKWGPWRARCRDIRAFLNPEGEPVSGTETAGRADRSKVLDNTAETDAEMLAATLVSVLTPFDVDFLGLRFQDRAANKLDGVPAFLDDVVVPDLLHVLRRPETGFSSCQHEKTLDLVHYGLGAGYIDEVMGRGIVAVSMPIGQIVTDENGHGEVDTVHRVFEYTARQAVIEWGDACHQKIRDAADDPRRQNEKFTFIHAVYPNRDAEPQSTDPEKLPLRSVWVDRAHKHVLKKSGFHEMPYQTPRWLKRAGNAMGRGPGHKALPDVASLQRGMEINFQGAEISMLPPIAVEDDGVLGAVRWKPGALIWTRPSLSGRRPIDPLQSGARPDMGEAFLQAMTTNRRRHSAARSPGRPIWRAAPGGTGCCILKMRMPGWPITTNSAMARSFHR